MRDYQFRAMLDLLMCCDPWPVDTEGHQAIIIGWITVEASKRGYDNWIEAYHEEK